MAMNKEKPCSRCGGTMYLQKEGQYYKCSDDDCGHINKPAPPVHVSPDGFQAGSDCSW